MEWTDKDKQNLLSWRKNIDNEDIRVKEKIKQILLNNKNIIHVLNNDELEKQDAEPDEYYGVNILPYYMIAPTQNNVKNYICFETSFDEQARYNGFIKIQQIIFYILSEQKDSIDNETGLARHDLLASLILDQFNWSNYFGTQIHCVSNRPSVVDTYFSCRTLIFEAETPVNVLRTEGVPRIINNNIRV